MIDTEIRVTAKAEYPVCYTCLYCGAENRDTLRYEATRVKTVRYTHNRHYQEEINEKKSQLQSEMYASFEKGVDLERRQVEGVAAFWEACQGEDMPSSPMITLRLPDKEYCCHQCFKVQPYAASYSTPLQTVSAISGVVTLFSALCGLMFFVISFGRDEQLFLTLAAVFGGAAAVLLPVFLWSFRKSRREQTALQYNEWHAIPYAPEKLPQFTKQIDREEES